MTGTGGGKASMNDLLMVMQVTMHGGLPRKDARASRSLPFEYHREQVDRSTRDSAHRVLRQGERTALLSGNSHLCHNVFRAAEGMIAFDNRVSDMDRSP